MIISETKDLQKILLRIQHEQIKMSTDIFKLTNNGTIAGNKYLVEENHGISSQN